MDSSTSKSAPRRFGQVIRLKKDCVEEYKACHAKAWPEVLEQIKDSNIEDCKCLAGIRIQRCTISPAVLPLIMKLQRPS